MTINEPSEIVILIKALNVLLVRSLAQFRYANNPILIGSIARRIERIKFTILVLKESNSTVGLSKNQIRQLLIAVNTLKNEENQPNIEIDQLQVKLIEAINIPKAKEEPSDLHYNQWTKALFSAKRKNNPYRIYTQ